MPCANVGKRFIVPVQVTDLTLDGPDMCIEGAKISRRVTIQGIHYFPLMTKYLTQMFYRYPATENDALVSMSGIIMDQSH